MKFLTMLCLLSISAVSFAGNDKKLIESCRQVGEQKILDQAKYLNLKVDKKDIKVCGVDNSNAIAKYVWFCATTTGGEEKITKLTQKPLFGKCF